MRDHDPNRTLIPVLVESCVTTVREAVDSAAAGARRLELCVDLEEGGLTPSPDLVREVVRAVPVPVFAMVRPRPGDFVYSRREIDRALRDVAAVKAAGAAGIVTGALRTDGSVDADALRRLVGAAGLVPVTFHRAFDGVADPAGALEALLYVGVRRVLTSGGLDAAIHGADALAGLVHRAGGRIAVMAGGRVRADHVLELVDRTGVAEVHARAEAVPDLVRTLASR
jgi:copper homeostasis protein